MRKFLRSLSLVLCTMLLLPLTALGHTGGERQTVRLTVETKEAQPGGTVRVDLLMTDCVSADSLECDINYDPAALQLERVENGDVFPKEYTVTNIKEKGRIRLAAISGPGVSAEGTVISMVFTVRGNGGSSILLTNVAVTTVDADNDFEQLFAYVLHENGGVTVNGAMTGAPAVTPWVGETPPPTPVPTPDPAEASTPEPAGTPEPTEAPVRTPEPEVSIVLPDREPIDPEALPSALLIMGIVFILLVLTLIALLIVNSASRRKRKRKKASRAAQRKKNGSSGKGKSRRAAPGDGEHGAGEENEED